MYCRWLSRGALSGRATVGGGAGPSGALRSNGFALGFAGYLARISAGFLGIPACILAELPALRRAIGPRNPDPNPTSKVGISSATHCEEFAGKWQGNCGEIVQEILG